MVESYSCIAAFYNPGNIRSEHAEAPRGDSRSTQILVLYPHDYTSDVSQCVGDNFRVMCGCADLYLKYLSSGSVKVGN